jgi:hypothetical protein
MTSIFSGNGSIEERKFRLKQLRDLSPTAKQINFATLEPAAFSHIEKIALAEARAGAYNSGRLFESVERDDGGRKIRSYEGDPNAWMQHFKAPGMTVRINKDAGMHEETIKVRDGQRAVAVSNASDK